MNDWSDAERHVEQAHEAYEDGRWDDAADLLRRALSLNPYRAEWHFNLGLTLEAAGRADALRAFRDCHGLDDRDVQVLLLLGVNSLRTGNARESVEWLEKASRQDPQNVAAFTHRIEAYARLGDHEQAEVMFYMAQQLDPTEAEAYSNLATSLLQRGLHEKAVWCLREAAHHDPALPKIHARLAEAYASTGRLERARQLYLRELRSDPGDVVTLLELGCLLVDMNRLPEAGEKFRRALEMEPDHAAAHFHLADLAERMGQTEAAMDGYTVVIRLEPEFSGARRRLARLLIERGRGPSAGGGGGSGGGDAGAARDLLHEELAELRQTPQRFDAEDAEELGVVLLDAQMPAEARTVLEGAVALHPTGVQARHHLSVACFQLGDRPRGIEQAREALRIDPKFVPAMHNIAVAYVHDRQWRRARYWVRQALEADPEDASLRRLRFKLRLHGLGDSVNVAWGALAGLVRRRR